MPPKQIYPPPIQIPIYYPSSSDDDDDSPAEAGAWKPTKECKPPRKRIGRPLKTDPSLKMCMIPYNLLKYPERSKRKPPTTRTQNNNLKKKVIHTKKSDDLKNEFLKYFGKQLNKDDIKKIKDKDIEPIKDFIESYIRRNKVLERKKKEIDDFVDKVSQPQHSVFFENARKVVNYLWSGYIDNGIKETKPRTEQRKHLLNIRKELRDLEKKTPKKYFDLVKKLENMYISYNSIENEFQNDSNLFIQFFNLKSIKEVGYGLKLAGSFLDATPSQVAHALF